MQIYDNILLLYSFQVSKSSFQFKPFIVHTVKPCSTNIPCGTQQGISISRWWRVQHDAPFATEISPLLSRKIPTLINNFFVGRFNEKKDKVVALYSFLTGRLMRLHRVLRYIKYGLHLSTYKYKQSLSILNS